MATTGFWPVKSRLKEVIDYADTAVLITGQAEVLARCIISEM